MAAKNLIEEKTMKLAHRIRLAYLDYRVKKLAKKVKKAFNKKDYFTRKADSLLVKYADAKLFARRL